MIKIRAAVPAEHKELCRLAKSSPYTASFSAMMFSGAHAYEKGWIRVARLSESIIGMTCVRHKVRTPRTMLYFIVVDPGARSRGTGRELMMDLEEQTPHPEIELGVAPENERAITFYRSLGYEVDSTMKDGRLLMVKGLR